MSVGAVLLSRGGRPDDLRRALESLLRQRGVDLDVLVVGNGWEPAGLPEGVRSVTLMPNVGIPAGRNAGAEHVRGDTIFFLDDDAALAEDDALARVEALLRDDPGIGMVQLRVAARDGGPKSRDWNPRLTSNERPGDVTLVWEGAVAIRRRVLEEAGGWPGEFMFIHEGVDLAWRVLDAGHRVHYAGDVVVLHPSPPATPTRHEYTSYYQARNRVWVARRNLPAALGAAYVATFALRTLPRLRDPRQVRAAARGYRDGVRGAVPGRRRPLRARTLWRMTRAGRPPVI